jgi:hypothetical protein
VAVSQPDNPAPNCRRTSKQSDTAWPPLCQHLGVKGTLIIESLQVGSTLRTLDLVVHEIRRFATCDGPEYQPSVWTALEFEAPDELADSLASALATRLDEPGWYANFSTLTETFVIYPRRIFHYPRHDERGRAEAQAHGRAVGVPEPQLDWTE